MTPEDFANNHRAPQTATKLVFRLVAMLLIGFMLACAFPPFRLPLLLPFALAALLLALNGVTRKQAFYLGFACGMAWFGTGLFWLTSLFSQGALTLWAIAAVYPALFCVLYVTLLRRFPKIPRPLLAATLWTAIEYLRSEPAWPNFGFFGLGYALADSPVPASLAALFGTYGLSFLIVLLGGLLATQRLPLFLSLSEQGRGTPKHRMSVSTGGFRAFVTANLLAHQKGSYFLTPIPLLAVWMLLLWLPLKAPEPRNPLTVHLVQAMSEDEESLFRLSKLLPSDQDRDKNAHRFPPSDTTVGANRPTARDLTPLDKWGFTPPARVANTRPDVILWPEYSFVSDPRKDQRRLWPQLQKIARDNRCYFLFGAKQQDDPTDEAKFRNTAFLLDPQGDLIGTHVKNHPIHFIRDGAAGTEAKAKVTEIGRLGIAICFDLDFPDVTRKLVQDGAEVFLVPSDNPSEWGDVQPAQHRQMFQMRAVEGGRWIASADVAGSTMVIAPTGQIVARVRTRDAESLTAQVGRETGQTLYARGGWRFGQLCLLAIVAALLVSLRTAQKRQPTQP